MLAWKPADPVFTVEAMARTDRLPRRRASSKNIP
jgi:hypothetical protein